MTESLSPQHDDPRFALGLCELTPRYDAFIVDQWGVLHEGTTPYPGAVDALNQLRAAGKTVVILTNSSKTAEANVARLERLGIPRTSYSALVSSAEVLRRALREQRNPPWAAIGKRAFVIAAGEDGQLLDDIGLTVVHDVRDAEFVVLLSVEGDADVDAHRAWLTAAAARGLLLVGPSADARSVSPHGVYVGLGALCDAYRLLGGSIRIVGKPEAVVYDECMRVIGACDRRRVAAVGDQLCSDVVGAARQGMDSILVGTGAAASTFAGARTPSDWIQRGIAASVDYGARPTWLLPAFRWSISLGPAFGSLSSLPGGPQ